MNRIAVKLKKNAESKIRKGHPWVFADSIVEQKSEAEMGDMAVIYGRKSNKLLAIGLFDPASVIRIKILSLHKSIQLDQEYFNQVLHTAKTIRLPLFEHTNAFRLINGESDGLAGMIIDVYDTTAVIKLYSEIWVPYLEFIKLALHSILKLEAIVLRLSRILIRSNSADLKDGSLIYGIKETEEVLIHEYGVKFLVNVYKGHKTGFFLDHRQNRHRIGRMSKSKKVLDVFSYAGGFSIHALHHGAQEVCSIDLSSHAMSLAQENAKLNKFKGTHRCIIDDAFKALENLILENEKFDIIIIDPPSFAKSTSEIERALHKYGQLASLATQLANDGAMIIMASCSSRVNKEDFIDAVENGFKRSKSKIEFFDFRDHDIDHPANFPEAHYLKCAYYKFSK